MKTFTTDNTIFRYNENKGTVHIYDKEYDVETTVNISDIIAFANSLKSDKETNSARIHVGDIVKHFKREGLTAEEKTTNMYLYKVLSFGYDTDSGKYMVTYMALYGDFKTYIRSYDEFMSEVDTVKYPNVNQKYRFEVYNFID